MTRDPRWDLCVRDTASAWCLRTQRPHHIHTTRWMKTPLCIQAPRAGWCSLLPSHPSPKPAVCTATPGEQDCFHSPLSDLPPYLQFQRPPLRPSSSQCSAAFGAADALRFFSGSTLSWLAPPPASLPTAPPPRWAPHPPSILKGGCSRESILQSPFPTGHTLLMGFDHFCSFTFVCDFQISSPYFSPSCTWDLFPTSFQESPPASARGSSLGHANTHTEVEDGKMLDV